MASFRTIVLGLLTAATGLMLAQAYSNPSLFAFILSAGLLLWSTSKDFDEEYKEKRDAEMKRETLTTLKRVEKKANSRKH